MKQIEDIKIVDKYTLMEEQLKDDARSIKFIKNLGKDLISKVRMIDEETNSINPMRKEWNTLTQENREKISCLHSLKDRYNAQFDMIRIVLNKSDNLMSDGQIQRYKEKGLENRFFINVDDE